MSLFARAHAGRRLRAGAAFAFVLAALAALSGCGAGDTVTEEPRQMASLANVPAADWSALAGKRVFFGHQSVGDNIMDGVADVLREKPELGLRVVTGDSASDGGPAIAHERIGRNGDPKGKTDAFAAKLEGGLGGRVDVAMHKYCFADILANSDPDAIFAHYKSTMARLHAEFPNVVFVHVTSAVVTPRGGGLRMLAHRLLGRTPERIAGNLKRARFNELMRREYAGKEPVFDLAAEEATRPDGKRVSIAWNGRTGDALDPGSSDDGSHLNAAGRRRVAEAMLVFLAGIPSSGGTASAVR